MAFDVRGIQAELAAAPIASPYPLDLAVAIVNDTFRMAGIPPVADATWTRWTEKAHTLWTEQMGMLAHALASTSLRAETARILSPVHEKEKALELFFEGVKPLTAEMIRANAFRQEEFLRRWVECWDGEVAGESAAQSKRRLEQLDYRKTLQEYARAERARREEQERRAREAREAAEREAAARGWRE
jgi:hypothetical protein